MCIEKDTYSKMNNIETTIKIVRRWLPNIDHDDKVKLNNILTGTEITSGTLLLRKYISLLKPYSKILRIDHNPREEDCIASGAVFFYGCLCYIMHFNNSGSHIEDILYYNILYILVDHYIDDIKVSSIVKHHAIDQMFMLLHDPMCYKKLNLSDPSFELIAITYHKLISRCPAAKRSIIKLFQSEIDGLSIQNKSNHTRNVYYDIALRKGGETMEVLRSIVDNDDLSQATYHLGTIVQLLDDMLDVNSDMKNNINTIATYDLINKGNLDELWTDTIYRINDIDPKFIIFKILFMFFAVYIPYRNENAFTSELVSVVKPMNLFELDASKLLVESAVTELISMELLHER